MPDGTTSALDTVLRHVDDQFDASLGRLFELMRIRSISTDSAFAADCRDCAGWLANELRSIGFSATAHDTPGHPIVVAHDRRASGPSALFYGHYDVQPVDPLDLWEHDPFDPFVETRADGRRLIRGRGAADDKGQLMTFVEACRAWRAVAGGLPLSLSILLKGEEESGGKSLPPFLKSHAEELRADISLICDTNMWNACTPAITTMLRGSCAEEVTITGASHDLHSGAYGSAAANPNRILARVLADLHDADGRVTIPGFYDAVPEPPPTLRDQWATLNFDPVAFLGAVGLSVPAGERGRSVLEMVWSRPTCVINGMGGGYQGEGFKTVIPARASAKVSFRLVFDQDPRAVQAAFRDFVRARVPADCKVTFTGRGGNGAIQFPIDAPAFNKARKALSTEWGRDAVFIGCGGSIPIASEFRSTLGMSAILAGFGLDDDRVHSPNEKYELESFRRGIRSWARILDALAH
jgi:acetylornithine deacetylase/succinyl-diaminopimelate desuccinylase-like protein